MAKQEIAVFQAGVSTTGLEKMERSNQLTNVTTNSQGKFSHTWKFTIAALKNC